MKVSEWGDSLAVRIPMDVAEALGLNDCDDVKILLIESALVGVGRRLTRDEAIERLRRFQGTMPADFKFNREKANAR